MKDWQQRLLDEKAGLELKINNLNKFVPYHDNFIELSTQDQALLKTQLDIMKAYMAILNARIVSYNIEEK